MSSIPYCRPLGEDQVFVGRCEELAFLHAQLDGVRGGVPRLVLVEGPAGIGKTALMRQFLAEENGLMLRHASGAEEESVLAYGVLSQLISSVSAAALDAPTVLPDTGPPGANPDTQLNPLTAGSVLLNLLGELRDTDQAAVAVEAAGVDGVQDPVPGAGGEDTNSRSVAAVAASTSAGSSKPG